MKKIKPYLVLHLLLMFFSLGGVCSKTAAKKPFLSVEFCFFYGLMLLILAIYALLWQQILKQLPLNIAYTNKAVSLIWGMIWGTTIFNESISGNNIVGAFIVFVGVLIMVTNGEKDG